VVGIFLSYLEGLSPFFYTHSSENYNFVCLYKLQKSCEIARFEVPTAVMKNVSLWSLKVLLDPEDEGSKLFRKSGNYISTWRHIQEDLNPDKRLLNSYTLLDARRP
jgi:hypothetical protein